jgi:excisionase family DNA binding protein
MSMGSSTTENQKGTDVAPERLTYRVKEVCHVLGLGETKVWEMIREGYLPTVKLGGATLVRRADLDRLIEHGYSKVA